MVIPNTALSNVTLCKQICDHMIDFQVKIYVQTACELHDLTMDLVPFNNNFKQPCEYVFLQEYLCLPGT